MTTYTKETALYDTGAIGSDIADAATTATSYLTDISGGGVTVHPSDDSTTGVQITDYVDILRGGTSVINIGTDDAVRVGVAGENNIVITDSGVDFSMPYNDGNGNTGTASASMSAGYGTYTDRSGTQNTAATFNITHGSTDLTMYNNGHANLASDLEVDNIEVMERANVGDTLMVGATHNALADTVVVNGGSVSVGTITNNATPSVSLDDSNNAVSFIISGSNRGIYDTTNSKWIVYSGSNNVTVANGLAASASGTSTSVNNYWTFINANTGVGVRFVLNPNSRNLVVMYTLNGGTNWSATRTLATWA